ncbi:MAG TPA: EamA family transporter [Deltaproteobacteria bacterium]|jgi:drug/metabolite transporter (DMT)-like permease|nr:EamA family transporter [Deltaproteobacteria bacterium]
MLTLVIVGGALCMALLIAASALPVPFSLGFVAFPDRAARPFLALAMLLHVSYNISLVRAYEHGDLSRVYPIARGAAPAFVAVGAWGAAGEALVPVEIAGILLLSGGIMSLALEPELAAGASRSALGWSLLTAAWIGTYSVCDGMGVRRTSNPLSFIAWLMLLDGFPILLLVLWLRRGRVWPSFRPHLVTGLAGGALAALAYGIVLWAMGHGRIAHVAALRETSVIVAAGIGTALLGEPFGRRRVVAACLVAAGAALLQSAR